MRDHTIIAAGYHVTIPPASEPCLAVIVSNTEPLLALTEPGPLDLRLHLSIPLTCEPASEPWQHLTALLTAAWAQRYPCLLWVLLSPAPTRCLPLTGTIARWGYDAAGYRWVPATASGHPGIVPEGLSTGYLTLTHVVLHEDGPSMGRSETILQSLHSPRS